MRIGKNTNDDCGCGPGWWNSGVLDITWARDGSAVQEWSFAPTFGATLGRPALPHRKAPLRHPSAPTCSGAAGLSLPHERAAGSDSLRAAPHLASWRSVPGVRSS